MAIGETYSEWKLRISFSHTTLNNFEHWIRLHGWFHLILNRKLNNENHMKSFFFITGCFCFEMSVIIKIFSDENRMIRISTPQKSSSISAILVFYSWNNSKDDSQKISCIQSLWDRERERKKKWNNKRNAKPIKRNQMYR